MNENDPEYEKIKKKKSELKRYITRYEAEVVGKLSELDFGMPGKTDAEFYWNKANELKQEYEELESKYPTTYSNKEIDEMKRDLTRREAYLLSMKNEQEIFGIPNANKIQFYENDLIGLKRKFKKVKLSKI